MKRKNNSHLLTKVKHSFFLRKPIKHTPLKNVKQLQSILRKYKLKHMLIISALATSLFSVNTAHAINGHLKERIGNNEARSKKNQSEIKRNSNKINADEKKIDTNIQNIDANKKNIETVHKKALNNELHTKEVESATSQNKIALHSLSEDFNQFQNTNEKRLRRIDKKISQNHKKAMAGVSAAMAMNAIPFIEGKSVSMGLGSGSYGGEGALAFGSQFKLSDKIRSSTYLSYDSNKNLGVAAGVSFGW